jgi:hypothetical protein
MQEAVHLAFDLSQQGDAVLLSPACASWDMFRNYAHRAEVFIAAVEVLATRGEDCRRVQERRQHNAEEINLERRTQERRESRDVP